MKAAGSLLIVSVLLGGSAALAAAVIGVLTSAVISPWGGALLGAAFGLSGGAFTSRRTRIPAAVLTVARVALSSATAALAVAFLQRP